MFFHKQSVTGICLQVRMNDVNNDWQKKNMLNRAMSDQIWKDVNNSSTEAPHWQSK